MDRNDILKQVEEIFREELELDDLVLTDETTAEDVEGWDFTSSYPAQMLANLFPMKTGRWRIVRDRKSFDYFRANYCCIFEV